MWTQEQDNFLIENINKFSWTQLAVAFNERFNEKAKVCTLRHRCDRNLKIKKAKECHEIFGWKYPKEVRDFIAENCSFYNNVQLIKLIKEKFDWELTLTQMKNLRQTLISNGSVKNYQKLFYLSHKIVENKELVEEIKTLAKDYCQEDVIRIVLDRHDYDYLTKTSLKSAISKLGIKCHFSLRSGYNSKEREEVEKYFLEHHNDQKTDDDLAKEIGEKFGLKISAKRMNKWRAKYGVLKSHKFINNEARIKYQPGSLVYNKRAVMLKLENGEWIEAKRYYYEKYHNCKLTKDDSIISVDGNAWNFDRNNLVKLTMNERNAIISQFYGMGEITLAAIDVARCKNLIKQLEEE